MRADHGTRAKTFTFDAEVTFLAGTPHDVVPKSASRTPSPFLGRKVTLRGSPGLVPYCRFQEKSKRRNGEMLELGALDERSQEQDF